MSAIGLHRVVSPAECCRRPPSGALDLVRTDPGGPMLFDARLTAD